MPSSTDTTDKGPQKAEHEANEARFGAIEGILSRAPAAIRGRAEREKELPESVRRMAACRSAPLSEAEVRSAIEPRLPARTQALAWGGAAGLSAALLAVGLLLSATTGYMVLSMWRLVAIISALFFAAAYAFLKRSKETSRRREGDRAVESTRLLQGDPAAVKASIESSLTNLRLPFPLEYRLKVGAGAAARLDLDLPPSSVIPEERTSMAKTGKVSSRALPERERNEMYARLVASTSLLLAGRALDAAPSLDEIIVSGFTPGVDPRTGEDVKICLVSVRAPRSILARLRLDRLDALAALENFEHRFEAGKAAALGEVDPIDAPPRAEAPAAPSPAGSARPAAEPPPSPRPRARRVPDRDEPAAARSEDRAGRADDAETSIAADALRVAIACARADGRFEEAEVRAIEKLIEERFAPAGVEKKRLGLLEEELKVGAIDVTRAAARLRSALGPIERRLLVEGILAALIAKGSPAEAEMALLDKVAGKLDLPPHTVEEMRARAGGSAAKPASEREKRLAALDLPPDVNVTRDVVERSARRVLDIYSEARLAGMGSEFAAMAARRRAGAEEARKALLAELPPEPPAAPPAGPPSPASPADMRRNPDLDAIFGS